MTERIVFVLPSFAGGGAERVIISLANNIDRNRFLPIVIALDGNGPLRETVAGDVGVVDLGRPRLRDALTPLVSAIGEIKPAAVVPTMGYLNLGLLWKKRQLPTGTRLIVREANEVDATLESLPLPWIGRFLYKHLYRRADRVIAPSQSIARDFRERWKVPAAKIATLSNPVDVARIRDAARVAQRHPGEGLRFVAAGRLVDQKGYDRLIEWMVDLPANAHLTIFGDGPLAGALRQMAQKQAVVAKVRFTGFVGNPWVAYAGADAFVMPSRWEGMPNAALEALALGTPVIGTPEAGGLTDVAETAAPGAVTIARAGDSFIAAMKNTAPKPLGELPPSLLPETYALAHVVERFEDLLAA